MAHCHILFSFVFFFVVVIIRAMKSNYSVINEKLSRDNETLSRDKWKIIARQMGNLLGSTWWTAVHVVYVETMTATVEEVWFEVTSLFYFREKIIEQYFAILLRHTALWISTVNVDFAKSKKHFPRWLSASENKCGLSNLSDYIAGL